ncbi:hypothetical protein CPB84DRAFT_1745734 [Gymnopilus junonius]|uniref:Uncharacterized protein n=1 Tax=Gymnopilus junonius TaxID=109634 RepID=A0A9P5NQ13_GYMJU|nr:hypothetical protein CPB84DRAFT_1745734 [Gymnopilus junonius]
MTDQATLQSQFRNAGHFNGEANQPVLRVEGFGLCPDAIDAPDYLYDMEIGQVTPDAVRASSCAERTRTRSCFQVIAPALRKCIANLGGKTLSTGISLVNVRAYTKMVVNWLNMRTPWAAAKIVMDSEDVPRIVIEKIGPTNLIPSRSTTPSSTYSLPSSRTKSTDYGIYFRRMALSEAGSDSPEGLNRPIVGVHHEASEVEVTPALPINIDEQCSRPNSPVSILRPLRPEVQIIKVSRPNSVAL